MNIAIYDDFISDDDLKELKNKLVNPTFAYTEETISVVNETGTHNFQQLVKVFFTEYKQTDYTFNIVGPVIKKIMDDFNMNANYKLRAVKLIVNGIQASTNDTGHVIPNYKYDKDSQDITMVFCINKTDGNVVFFDSDKMVEEVEPKQNRLIIFESKILYSKKLPMHHNDRIVLEIDFERMDWDAVNAKQKEEV